MSLKKQKRTKLSVDKKKKKYPDCFIMGRARAGFLTKRLKSVKEYIKLLFDKGLR